MDAATIAEVHERLRSMDAEEVARYQQIGKAATLSHRAGGAAFGPSVSVPNAAQWGRFWNPRALPPPGHAMSGGAIPQEDHAAAAESSLLSFTGQSFEKKYESFKSSICKRDDPVSLTVEEETALKTSEQDVRATPAAVLSEKGYSGLAGSCRRKLLPHPTAPVAGLSFHLPVPDVAKACCHTQCSKCSFAVLYPNLSRCGRHLGVVLIVALIVPVPSNRLMIRLPFEAVPQPFPSTERSEHPFLILSQPVECRL